MPSQLRLSPGAYFAAASERALPTRRLSLRVVAGRRATRKQPTAKTLAARTRLHTGKVTVPTSNPALGWRHHQLALARTRKKLRLAVVIDCADRMILAGRVAARVLAEDVCELGLRGVVPALWRGAAPGEGFGVLGPTAVRSSPRVCCAISSRAWV